ncbi:hypothetical protein, partial [Helicobacter sp. 13S00401-1]|uniref:hypothetical protein n=1 Tax=Helicobacter sp. 13S00401-1 TaxID=1905758 RepID=UPI00155534B5
NGSFINASTRANGSVAAGATVQNPFDVFSQTGGVNSLASIDPIANTAINNQFKELQNLSDTFKTIQKANDANYLQAKDVNAMAQMGIKYWLNTDTDKTNNNPTVIYTSYSRLSGALDLLQNKGPTTVVSTTFNGITNTTTTTDSLVALGQRLSSAINGTSQGINSNSLSDTLTRLERYVKQANDNITRTPGINYDAYNNAIAAQTTAINNLQNVITTAKKAIADYNTTYKANDQVLASISVDFWDKDATQAANYIVGQTNNIKTATQNIQDAAKKLDDIINNGVPGTTTAGATTAAITSLQKAIDDVAKTSQQVAVQRVIIAATQAASEAASQASLNAAAQDAARRKNSTPTILPTAKAGLIAFFGKHQSVSVEYQYYFRNTNPSFTSGEVTLNYAYYFGGK